MRKNSRVGRRNVCNSKQALVESIMAKVRPIVEKALNETEVDEFAEYAINSPSEGKNRYVVILDGGYVGYYIYADDSDEAIDYAFDYAFENDPQILNDDEAIALMRKEKRRGTPEDDIFEMLDDIFYSGGNEGVHYTYREDFSIQELD